MKISGQLTDRAVLAEVGARLRRRRLQRNQTQQALADEAGVSKRTVERLEGGGSAQLSSFLRICRALGLLERLEALVPEPLPSPIEQLDLGGKQRQRASKPSTEGEPTGDGWTWGEEG
jgi:transcriptional regulator with XRE-family HTH domain